jgi:hypothetical protein
MIAALGAVAGAAGSYFGAAKAADAQKEAAAAQKYAADRQFQATQDALGLQREVYNRNVGYETPWMNAGTKALKSYGTAVGLNGAGAQKDWFTNFQNDPYYQGTLNAGTNAVSNSAAARGTLYSGNTLRDINDYGANLQKAAYDTRLSNLGTVMGYGAGATNALAGVGSNYANTSGLIGTNAANNGTNMLSTAANTQAGAGILQGNGVIGASNALIGGLNNYVNMQRYNDMNGYSSGYGAYAPGYSSDSWKAWTEQ